MMIRQRWVSHKHRLTPYFFLLPAIVILGLTVFLPSFQAFFLSFTRYDLNQSFQWVGLENFQRLSRDRIFQQTVLNTLLYLIVVVPLLVLLPLGLAILVNQKIRGISWFRMLLYSPVLISMVVAGLAWKAIYASNGLLNQLYQQAYLFCSNIFLQTQHNLLFVMLVDSCCLIAKVSILFAILATRIVIFLLAIRGLLLFFSSLFQGFNRFFAYLANDFLRDFMVMAVLLLFEIFLVRFEALALSFISFGKTGIPWLTEPQLSLWSVMIVTTWKGLGYYMVIYLAGLQAIAPELYEAAAIDGSQGWLKHWYITLPLMRPYLVLVAVISAISATKVFEEVYIMTQGGPLNSSKTVVYYLYEQAFENLEISYGCAIGLVLFLGILGLSLLNLYWSKQRNLSGGNLPSQSL